MHTPTVLALREFAGAAIITPSRISGGDGSNGGMGGGIDSGDERASLDRLLDPLFRDASATSSSNAMVAEDEASLRRFAAHRCGIERWLDERFHSPAPWEATIMIPTVPVSHDGYGGGGSDDGVSEWQSPVASNEWTEPRVREACARLAMHDRALTRVV